MNDTKEITIIENELGVEKPKVRQEQIQAAYALNLCAVSVSQIIDYNDINILPSANTIANCAADIGTASTPGSGIAPPAAAAAAEAVCIAILQSETCLFDISLPASIFLSDIIFLYSFPIYTLSSLSMLLIYISLFLVPLQSGYDLKSS